MVRSGSWKCSSGSSSVERTTPTPVGEGWIMEGERATERDGETADLFTLSVAGIDPRSLTAENNETPP